MAAPHNQERIVNITKKQPYNWEEALRAWKPGQGTGQTKKHEGKRGIPQMATKSNGPSREQPKPFPPFLTFAQLMEPLPPPEWEVEPLFCQGDRVLVFGRSTARKSWLLMHMGICLAAGLPWLEKFGISKPRKVLYIDKLTFPVHLWGSHRCGRAIQAM
jgi:hypothetical protein